MKHLHSAQQYATPSLCRICGDIARGLNFSVLSCMSCKMFFRRHAQSSLLKQRCRFDGRCIITRKTRKFCLPCRLRRCFAVGMDIQLIRHSHQRKKTVELPKPRPIGLLNKDRSMLTIDEWNLLSNIVNTYNEQNLVQYTQDFLKNQYSLPPKLRSKESNTLSHLRSLFSIVHLFIGRCPLFYSLPVHIRQTLIRRNFNAVGGFNAFYLAKELNIFEHEFYSKLVDNIYGNGYSNSVIQAGRNLQKNGTLIKVMLMIIAFLSNTSIMTINYSENVQLILNSKILVEIQDVLVTMLWKYLIYQYGFNEAVVRYLSLIKSVLDFIQRVEKLSSVEKHWSMVGSIVEQTEQSLALESRTI